MRHLSRVCPVFENVERRMTESLVYYMLAYKSVHTKCDSSPTEMLKYRFSV